MVRFLLRSTLAVIFGTFAFVIAGCGDASLSPTVEVVPPVATQLPSLPVQPEQVAATERDTTLRICLGQEPNSLYPLGELNRGAKAVLSAIYDGPIQLENGVPVPVILDTLPTTENEDLIVVPVGIKKGDLVVDSTGNVIKLQSGVSIFPSGCRDSSCVVSYGGQTDLQMDQVAMTFHLSNGIEWSDGEPLEAADYLYGFELAKKTSTPKNTYITQRTLSYEEVDDNTIQWWGLPGYMNVVPSMVLVPPMPTHYLSENDPAALLGAGEYIPLGWGPYGFDEWVDGEMIRLVRNPNYFRESQSPAPFEAVEFFFTNSAQEAVAGFIAGNCDLIDPSVNLESELSLVLKLQEQGLARAQISGGPMVEYLFFREGDQATTPRGGTLQEQDPLANPSMRQAIAYCLDRPKLVSQVTQGLAEPIYTYILPGAADFTADVAQYGHDTLTAKRMLDEAGWKDPDNDQGTPRVSSGVDGIPNGMPLELRYVTLDTLQRRQIGQIVASSLWECGIGVDEQYLSAEQFYDDGANSPLFGKNFDLLQVAAGFPDGTSGCSQFISSQIPAISNKWTGTNISGYSNPDFDQLCGQATNHAGVDDVASTASKSAQQVFANDLPALALFQKLNIVVSKPDVCAPKLDGLSENSVYLIEFYRFGNDCDVNE